MEWYVPVKQVHMVTAYLSFTLFLLRFAIDISGKTGWRKSRWRLFPHLNDTLLLITALLLVMITGWRPGEHFWLTVKLGLVVGYIVMGWFAMRSTLRVPLRWVAFLLAATLVMLIFYFATYKPI